MSICELTPMAFSLLLMLLFELLRVMAWPMRPMWLSTELLRVRSLERPRYLLFGNRSVSEKRFRLILIVRSRLV